MSWRPTFSRDGRIAGEKQPSWAGRRRVHHLDPRHEGLHVAVCSSLPATWIERHKGNRSALRSLTGVSGDAKDSASVVTPDQFKTFVEAVSEMMKTQPNYAARDMGEIRVPVAIVQGEHEEFIKLEHAEYLARSIPEAELIVLPGVSHFAPLQRPEQFNNVLRAFLGRVFS
jgi:pimeloyl-ACP methyl ester carboxylesterase